jgi:hypothetical protein
MNFSFKMVSSLAKVLQEAEPDRYPVNCPASMLLGEVFSLQAAYCLDEDINGTLPFANIQIRCDLPVTVRQVFAVPVRFPRFGDSDTDYITSSSKLYPDLLRPIHHSAQIRLYPHQWDAIWLDVEPLPDTKAGIYPLSVSLSDQNMQLLGQGQLDIELIAKELPRQTLIHTRWLHADSLAIHYHVPVLSVEHNRILRNYIALAARRGMNMILTPIHTPPLDTQVGGERLTIQLVDVFMTPLGYTFKFSKLRDFIAMCRHEGIRYFEMAHLFTQWGGLHAPKIMGIRDGSYTQLFGWDTSADDPEYIRFLSAYLPAVASELDHLDVLDKSYFHLTDEPGLSDCTQYQKLLSIVRPLIPNAKIIDAMSHPDCLKDPEAVIPVPSIDSLGQFEKIPLKERWTYYCVSQHRFVTNTFIAMPSPRTRILGVQLYLTRMTGFLHWAFNYYFSQNSVHPIDPYLNTDCSGFAPAGDAFQVYPGEGGQPEESLRLMLFQHAMQDLRALNLLEKMIGRDKVAAVIHQDLDAEITMTHYPRNEAWLLKMRQRVNSLIKAKID